MTDHQPEEPPMTTQTDNTAAVTQLEEIRSIVNRTILMGWDQANAFGLIWEALNPKEAQEIRDRRADEADRNRRLEASEALERIAHQGNLADTQAALEAFIRAYQPPKDSDYSPAICLEAEIDCALDSSPFEYNPITGRVRRWQ